MGSVENVESFKPAEGLNGEDERANNWKTPGPAAFDFRSKSISLSPLGIDIQLS